MPKLFCLERKKRKQGLLHISVERHYHPLLSGLHNGFKILAGQFNFIGRELAGDHSAFNLHFFGFYQLQKEPYGRGVGKR